MKKTSDLSEKNSLVKRAFGQLTSFLTEVESEKNKESNAELAEKTATPSTKTQNAPIKMAEKQDTNKAPKIQDTRIINSSSTARSYISSDVVIDGSISLSSDMDVDGVINGDVTSKGFVGVCGHIKGNVYCKSIMVENAHITGDITVQDSIEICGDTKVEGNLKAINITVNSAVKGDISASEKLLLGSKAVIMGNIEARNLIVETDAVINGNVKIIRDEVIKATK